MDLKALYKYREMSELNFNTLKDKEIYLSSASDFNDRSEFSFHIDEKLINSQIKEYLDSKSIIDSKKIIGHLKISYLTSAIYDVLNYAYKHYYQTDTSKKFFNNLSDYLFDVLDRISYSYSTDTYTKNVNRIADTIPFKISDKPHIDDAFQDYTLHKLFKYKGVRSYKFISDYISCLIQDEFYKMFYVYCLSETHKDPSMWGKYAQACNGFVIKYSISDLLEAGTVLSSETKVKNFFNEKHTVLAKVNYENKSGVDYTQYCYDYFLEIVDDLFNRDKNDIPLIKEKGIYSLYHKDPSWAHEKEYRLISNHSGLRKLKPSALYLGRALDTVDRHRLIKVALELNIEVYVMEENNYKSNYEIKFVNCRTKKYEV